MCTLPKHLHLHLPSRCTERISWRQPMLEWMEEERRAEEKRREEIRTFFNAHLASLSSYSVTMDPLPF